MAFQSRFDNTGAYHHIKSRELKRKKEKTNFLTVFLLLLLLLSIGVSICVAQDDAALGDKFYAMRNIDRGAKAAEYIDSAIYYYKKCLTDDRATDNSIYKYVRAVDFKYYYIVTNSDIKKKQYKELLSLLQTYYPKYKASPYMNYCLALVWGRYGELIGVLKAAREGIAGKVKEYGEKLYSIDPTFQEGVAGVILGRLHYKTPRIPLVLSWPSLKRSEMYLREVVKRFPSYLRAKLYLADTLKKMGKEHEAQELYKTILSATPAPSMYIEELAVIEEAKKRINAN